MTSITPFLDTIQSVASIKKTETILPIVRKTVYITPLVVGDDLSLRTALVSPVAYDRELIKLLINHLEIKDNQSPIDINQFMANISNIDKLSMVWALLKSTYETFAEDEEVTCECGYKMKINIDVSDLIHEDTYTLWDKKDDNDEMIPFFKYTYPIILDQGDIKYTFQSRLPSMKDNNDLLNLVPIDQIQYNLENINSLFDQTLSLALLIKSIKIESASGKFNPVETNNLNEIILTLKRYIPKKMGTDFLKKYEDHYNKYIPKFYKVFTCTKCGKENNYFVDLETSLFRKSLLD